MDDRVGWWGKKKIISEARWVFSLLISSIRLLLMTMLNNKCITRHKIQQIKVLIDLLIKMLKVSIRPLG